MISVAVRAMVQALIIALLGSPTSAFAGPEGVPSPLSEARTDIPRRLLAESLYRVGTARGPDGNPYLFACRMKASDADRATATPVRDLAKFALEAGIGLAVFEKRSDATPLWVFSAGAVADVARDRWNPDTKAPPPDVNVPGTHLLFGTPSVEMIPIPLRSAIAAHMRAVEKIAEPKIVLIVVKNAAGQYEDRRYVAPNIRRSAYPSEAAWLEALHRVEWYLPPSLVAIRPPVSDLAFDRYFEIVHPIVEAAQGRLP